MKEEAKEIENLEDWNWEDEEFILRKMEEYGCTETK